MDLRRLLALLLLAGCASAPVSLEIVPAPPALERRYGGFWEAALALDYERAALLATSASQADYARALRALADGRVAAAQETLSGLTGDAEAAGRVRALLTAIAKEGDAVSPQDFRSRVDFSFVEALLGARRAERWWVPEAGVSVLLARGGSPMPLVPLRVNGHGALIGLDTGAGLSVIGSDLADAAGAKRLGARTGARDVHGHSIQSELAVVDIDIAGLRIERHPVLVVDSARLRSMLEGVEGFGFDGVLGWNALAKLRITIDNPQGTVRFERSAGARAAGDLFWIGEPYVRARAANGLPLTLFLDSGASRSALAATVTGAAGLTGGIRQRTRVSAAATVREIEVVVHRDAALHVGGTRLAFGELQAFEPRSTGYAVRDGVLGADALARGRIVLDAGARELTIRP